MSIPYQFLPWVRRGLARAHQASDTPGAPARPQIQVGLTLQARQDGQNVQAVSGQIDLRLYGPGDVIGIDPRLVVRTEPRAGTRNFEPNYLAAIDFDPPDFPWMMTPAAPDGDQRLRPWLALVVLRSTAGTEPRLRPGAPLPSVSLSAAQVGDELPDLADAALWAHAQAVSTRGAGDAAGLAAELQQRPETNVSRLVCPRRLEPDTAYIACVVPAFEVGRLRGLGQPVPADATLAPAWNRAAPSATELPVYHHWSFGTGPVGDIEALARRIRTPEQYAREATPQAQLKHIGELPVAVDADHLLFEGARPDRTVFEGALVSTTFEPQKADAQVADKLAGMLNSDDALVAGTRKADKSPTLSPPIYGAYPARRHRVDPAQRDRHWLDQLNLQPRYRMAAGWGAEIVRRHQDEFMQAAWEQVGEVLAAERAFSLGRLAHDVLRAVERRHLARLPEHRLLAVLAPARGRLRLGEGESLYGRIEGSTLPAELFDGAMRRFSAPTRPTLRLARLRAGATKLTPDRQMQQLVTLFAQATQNLARIDQSLFVPDGLNGSRSYDAIPMPADPAQSIDLLPYLGLPGSITGAQLQQLRQQRDAARAAAERAKPVPPQLGDIWRTGILTEVHQRRLRELQAAAGQHLDMEQLQQLVRQAGKSSVDGVLVSVSAGGQASAQGLKIEAASGKVKPVGALQVPKHAGTGGAPAKRGAAVTLAKVPPQALRQYGSAAVWAGMPVGTLDPRGEAVDIRFDKGRFAPAPGKLPPKPAEPVFTVTLPPPERSPTVLARYENAFTTYHAFKDSVERAQSIVPVTVDLALQQAAQLARQRVAPAHTVPQRLASSLTLGNQTVHFSEAQELASPYLQTRVDMALQPHLRFVVPRLWDRVMAYPHLTMPLARKLERLAPEVFLPGVGALPDDFIMAVKTNPRFVEALMLGANHEMGRELLWQGYPTDQRGTPLRHFWQRLDGAPDIEPIHRWAARPLGGQDASASMLVLLIRGQLLQRFPDLAVYAYRRNGDKSPGGDGGMQPAQVQWPVLRGQLGSDITYVGFDPVIRPELDSMQEWFFVLEEHMTEPRFGFDEQTRSGPTWQDVGWDQLRVAPGQCLGAADLRRARPASQDRAWPHAAQVAEALLQRPFRGYYHGARLAPT